MTMDLGLTQYYIRPNFNLGANKIIRNLKIILNNKYIYREREIERCSRVNLEIIL